MSHAETSFEEGLKPYLPEGTAQQVAALLAPYNLKLTITKPRKTKKGDYRPPAKRRDSLHQISINRDLNPYAFLVTLLHELAHLQTHERYHIGNIKPHGPEWKACFRALLRPFWDQKCFPEPVKEALTEYLKNPSAATCTAPALTKALRAYDAHHDQIFVSDVPFQAYFYWQETRLFQRLKKQRTRYEALEVHTGRYYRIHQHALVKPYKED
jgi:SprT protein